MRPHDIERVDRFANQCNRRPKERRNTRSHQWQDHPSHRRYRLHLQNDTRQPGQGEEADANVQQDQRIPKQASTLQQRRQPMRIIVRGLVHNVMDFVVQAAVPG